MLSENDWLDELAHACRILHAEGHSDLTLGHLSLRDRDGRGFWLKRSGIGLGEVMGAKDFILIDFEGGRRAGDGRLHKEWPIHAEILRRRADVDVVGHTHPFHATVFSAADETLAPLTNDAIYLGDPPGRFEETTGLIDTPERGASLARALGDASSVLMRNHGVCFVGPNIAEAAMMGIFLERACRAQLAMLATSRPYAATSPSEIAAKRSEIFDPALRATFWAFLKRQTA
jgi:L-fuculose-phosphate aldolase